MYPNIHPTHQAIIEIVNSLKPESICDLGAGCGEVSKYLFHSNPALNITCVEHNKHHFKLIKEHFETNTGAIPPNIKVKATLINDHLPYLSLLKNNAYDLVFTSSVMMHIPFIIAIRSALEIVRVSKRYILHVENKNDGDSWYNMTVVKPDTMSSPANYLGIDYVALYESLGIKTLSYAEYQYPDSPATYIVYLGEKPQQ